MSYKVSDQIRGKAMRFLWTDGPMQNTVQEHLFYPDGTVEWHTAPRYSPALSTTPIHTVAEEHMERPHYAAMELTPDICMLSYLSMSGHTLTVALTISAGTLLGVASNATTWEQVKGTFEIIDLE
jgi:hypothetical protein